MEIPAPLLKALGDSRYDRRKAAASDIERLVRSLSSEEDVLRCVQQLTLALSVSQAFHARSGSLIALASVSIALFSPSHSQSQSQSQSQSHSQSHSQSPSLSHSHSQSYSMRLLPEILLPIFPVLADSDSRLRYYSCESLYNISKVARSHLLPYFNDIFDILARVSINLLLTHSLPPSLPPSINP